MILSPSTQKSQLLSTASVIGIQIAAVALFPAAANAQWGAVAMNPETAQQVATGGNIALDVSGANSLEVAGDEAAVNNNQAGSTVVVNTTDTADGIISTGDFSALQITGTGTAATIGVTQGTISSEGVAAGTAAIEITGAASATAITIGAQGTVTNAATGGDAIYIGGANAFTGSITNNGTISTTNNAGSIGIHVNTTAASNVTINNAGTFNAGALGTAILIANGHTAAVTNSAGTMTGAVNLGNQAASTFNITGGTVAGNITLGNNAQALTLNGGQVNGTITGGAVTVDNAYTSNGNINVNTLTIATGDSLNASANNNAITTAGALTIGNGSTLQLGTGALTAGSVVGASAGQGTLRYSGNNSTTGAIGTTSLSNVTIDNGVTLGMGHNVTATTTTVGSGTSGIVNQTAGTLASALTLNAGSTFTQTGTGSINGAATLGTGSTLSIGGAGVTGAINGAGAGQGALVYTGNSTTAAAIGATSLASATVNNGVTLGLGHNLGATTVNVGTGTSGVVNQTAGTITATTVAVANGGTLTQSGTGAISGNATVGTGGTLTLGGSGITGTVQGATANNGAVVVGASQTTTGMGNTTALNSITVNSTRNLTLGGNLGATTVTNNGTISAGAVARTIAGNVSNNAGTLALSSAAHTLTGNLNTDATSTITAAITGTTNNASGRIASSGTVALANGTTVNVDVSGAGARIARGTTYDIVTGTGAQNGTLTLVDNGTGVNQYLNFVRDTSQTNKLQLFANAVTPFTTLTTTNTVGNTNLENAAAVLENNGSVIPTGNMLTYLNRLDTLFAAGNTAGLNAAINEGITQDDSSAQTASFNALNNSADAVSNRLTSLRSGVSSGDAARDRGVWAQVFGTNATQDARDGIAGYDADTYGLAGGLDKAIGSNKRLGASISYANTEVDSNGGLKSTDIDTYQANLYGTYNRGALFVDGLVGGAYHNLDSRRTITAPAVVASGDYNAASFLGKVDAGYIVPMNRGFDLTPKAGITYGYTNFESYTETGAGGLNLTVDNKASSSVRTNIGADLGYTYTGATFSLRPVISAAYLHDFADNSLSTVSSFAGSAGNFRTNGLEMADNGVLLGGSLTLTSHNNLSLIGEYDYEVREDYDAHSGLLRARYNF